MASGLGRTPRLALAAAVLAVGCTTGPVSHGPPPSSPSGGAVITAEGQAFDRAELVVPAGRRFQLLFENRDGAPHNVSLFDGESGDVLFAGEIFGGPGSRTYEIPPITAGTYRFRCDVHPEMAGALISRSP